MVCYLYAKIDINYDTANSWVGLVLQPILLLGLCACARIIVFFSSQKKSSLTLISIYVRKLLYRMQLQATTKKSYYDLSSEGGAEIIHALCKAINWPTGCNYTLSRKKKNI